MSEGVVLLHGIFRTARHMQKMADFLRAQGYVVLNLTYPSTRQTLAQLAETIHPAIDAFARPLSRVHLVGYSMGGLLIRAYLAQHPLPQLGRVVMIGTPNHGSELADFLQHWWLYKRLYGPAGQQLVTSYDHSPFGQVTYELGILAGTRWLNPLANHLIGQANDGTVSVASTRLEGMKDHRILPATHFFFPSNRLVWTQLLHFLQQGHFTNIT